MRTLAIETSCDETSIALLEGKRPLANIISSQISHNKFGGVVPETASREHVRNIMNVTKFAFEKSGLKPDDVDVVAATYTPGLIGALLVGMNFGKSLAATLEKPFVPVNHIHAHVYSVFLEEREPEFPFLSLIVSGGHTLLVLVNDYFNHRIIGSTIDDAAGEAFDKASKMLGLGYPGGPAIDRIAEMGDENFHKFPIPEFKNKEEYNFSFSGLKTALLYYLKNTGYETMSSQDRGEITPHIAASFRTAAVKQLLNNTVRASIDFGINNIAVCGGVSANTLLKKEFFKLRKSGYNVFVPSTEYSTDNAAMIGITAYFSFLKNNRNAFADSLMVKAEPRLNKVLF
ncbi:tRNA (adenosine(37)-N6)-threonylcarbamoyltransferase complex transferase subunit TsaD [Ignavibacteria bacterium CHB1]|nr:MAG: tRNA (adenosine(37)-N6)-threonylcarbamoyltransferase complex transferase subunit TsaD [Chlorobiota bacterium]MBW7856178.1 tRNA (adenosine(37)-N6)-threonylcarbamoyltransferase complex transferase subunit TsaD [Ignavibacteria bacterium]MCE7953047.1 tRNA (adenosine(37)-N6)-threonylcarbamoyltransferase complex transferase subunit TsaD [Chlorobi bacterium CHB7]MDL1887115.1 tRNA (adenosine(37)-N6)-threonylcarbamoyltransferase complex transferase subunit TsaD [Ignavibacteria bacterium CHB1]OQY